MVSFVALMGWVQAEASTHFRTHPINISVPNHYSKSRETLAEQFVGYEKAAPFCSGWGNQPL
jgi:hypothetical protein